jgi:hypothetical protein
VLLTASAVLMMDADVAYVSVQGVHTVAVQWASDSVEASVQVADGIEVSVEVV